jgi:hypothetical protein
MAASLSFPGRCLRPMPVPSVLSALRRRYSMKVATAPVNWNSPHVPDYRPATPYPQLLEEMKAAGYTATEWSTDMPKDPADGAATPFGCWKSMAAVSGTPISRTSTGKSCKPPMSKGGVSSRHSGALSLRPLARGGQYPCRHSGAKARSIRGVVGH